MGAGFASAGTAAVLAGVFPLGGRGPLRIGREPGATTGWVSLVLADETSGATTAVGASPECGVATGTVGTGAGADWLISATAGAAGGTGASGPDNTGGAATFGSAASVGAAIDPGLTTTGIGGGTGKDASRSGTGSAGTGTAAGVAKLASGTTFTSPEIKSFSCRSEL